MNKLILILKLLVVLVFALFFSIIGINKKTIDSYDNKDKLEENIDILRGIIWSNYTFITISLAIAVTIIITKKYYIKYKWIVLFAIFFIFLNTGMLVFEEFGIKKIESVQVSNLNNIYIISSIMNIVYFILFVKMIKIIDDISNPIYSLTNVSEYIYPKNKLRNVYSVDYDDIYDNYDDVPNYF